MKRCLDGAGRLTPFTSAALCTALVLGAPMAAAQAPSAAPAQSDRDAARERFERGRDLFKRESFAPALAEFLESRRLYPTSAATAHAATCLRQLGRVDESLEMFATLLRDFGDKLTPDAKQVALQEIEQTRKLVGTIEVEGAVAGAAIVVDQQDRGAYPLLSPLRVPTGSHIVRVYKEGYEPFEKHLDVAGGTTVHVTARLVRLKETGTLQVSESLGRTLEVVVDGITVGKTGAAPLLLPLAPGKHVVHLRGAGNLGTAPAGVTIKVNEVAPLRIEAEQLDALLRVDPTPFDALVSVDSVLLGRGRWEGRVRPGKHTIEVGAEGFLAETRQVMIGRDKREVVAVLLPRDPKSPFWRKPPPPPHFVVELGTGLLLAPSFGGDVAGACAGGCSQTIGTGSYNAVRAGYQLGSGLAFGVSAGTLTMRQKTRNRATTLNVVGHPSSVTVPPPKGDASDAGTIDDSLSLRGLMMGAWVGYSVDPGLPLHFRLGAGGLFGSASDVRRNGVFTATGGTSIRLDEVVETHAARFVYVTPEVRLGLPFGRHVELNVGLEVPLLFGVSRPTWSGDTHGVHAGPDGYGWFKSEPFVGSVVVGFVPTIGARFDL